jgi:hypothetical protein
MLSPLGAPLESANKRARAPPQRAATLRNRTASAGSGARAKAIKRAKAAPKKAKLAHAEEKEEKKSRPKKAVKEEIRLAIAEVAPRRFNLRDAADREAGQRHLQAEGYVVWRDVVPAEDIGAHLGRLWDYLEAACPGVLRTEPATWTNARWPGVMSMFILRYHGVGQSSFMWGIRALPLLRFFFEDYYAHVRAAPGAAAPPSSSSTPPSSPSAPRLSAAPASIILTHSSAPDASSTALSSQAPPSQAPASQAPPSQAPPTGTSSSVRPPRLALATSFDGCSVLRPDLHEQTFSKSWLHTDANLRITPRFNHSVQCAVNLVAGRPHSHGAFVCVPRSHLHYRDLARSRDLGAADAEAMRRLMKASSHFTPIPGADHCMLRPFVEGTGEPADPKRVRAVALVVEAGDMVSWLSPLIHANTHPTGDKAARAARKAAHKSGAPPAQDAVGLRRVAAFVSFFPKDDLDAYRADPARWAADRRRACASGFTAGHDPRKPSENNHSMYPRSKGFQPVLTPPACLKTTFTDAELALL